MGGGLLATGPVVVVNCLFNGNSTWASGGGARASETSTFTNCTFTNNWAARDGGGAIASMTPTFTNCIFWGNTDSNGTGEAAQLFRDEDAVPAVTFSCIQRLDYFTGDNNIAADPLFVDTLGLDGIPGTPDDDLRLSPGSPCINTGSNRADIDGSTPYWQLLPMFDMVGHQRILCQMVDMGPYEFGPGDFDCDQSVDLTDCAAWPTCMTGPHGGPYDFGCNAFDFVYDLDVDLEDFSYFQSMFHFGAEP